MSIILGTALLSLVYSEDRDYVPYTITHNFQLMYNYYRNLDFEETNPVKRSSVKITGNKGQVFMDKISIYERLSGTGTTIADRPMHEHKLAIYSQLGLINDSLNSLRVKIEEGEVLNHRRF